MNAPSSLEKKLVLPPAALVKLLYKIKGGSFIDANDTEIADLLQEIEFPTGEEGREPKLEASEQGNLFVNRSIVTVTAGTRDAAKILVLHRGDTHAITTGGSIMTSGDPRKAPGDILNQKVTTDPAPQAFDRLGFALSHPDKTKGINYLFEVFRAKIEDDAQVMTTIDNGSLVTFDEAEAAIREKPTEMAVLDKLRKAS